MSELGKTQQFEDMVWIAPVEDVGALPTEASDGSLCFVHRENAVYQFYAGVWVKSASRGDPERRQTS